MNKIENFVKNKYDEKIKKNDTLPEDKKLKKNYEDYKEEIQDYLVTQINTSKEIYALYSLFDIARDAMISAIFEDLVIELNKQKFEVTKELEGVIQNKIIEFTKKLMKSK